MIDQGATSVWERWDAFTSAQGYANGGNVSLAHRPLASVVAWLFATVAGISPAEPGFRSITLAPLPGGGLTWAEASYESVRGRIALRWELAGTELNVAVIVPPNVTARLVLPVRSNRVRVDGRSLESARGVREIARPGTGVVLELRSGSYSFSCGEPVLAR